jgi:hypothetical protein
VNGPAGEAASATERPTAFRYTTPPTSGRRGRLREAVKSLCGVDLYPSDAIARAFIDGLSDGDPVAERFVAETYHAELGPGASRDLLDRALATSIADVPEAPDSMRTLFEEFEQVPDWVDRDLVEQGAAVWRRWGYALGASGNGGTMDTYTEATLALPLSLSGGYAGKAALNRYLETTKWWLEVSRPGALLTPGSAARTISMKVRVMHVSVRARVLAHEEWDSAKWGLPISQSEMLLTLLGGSIGPALGLTALGYITSPDETRAVLHFNRYCGWLVGCRCDGYMPETVLDGWRILLMCDAARAYDAGTLGTELVESFITAFAPLEGQHGLEQLRARYHFHLQAGFSALFMLPWNRRRYELPSPLIGLALLAARAPVVFSAELLRRASPRFDRRLQQQSHRSWERWYEWQSAGRRAKFEAARDFRR